MPYFDLNLPWVYMCPHPEHPPPHFPPYPIPLGHPSAPALSALSHASNLDWWFVSHMIIYIFQCHSPISSRPSPSPTEPERLFNRKGAFFDCCPPAVFAILYCTQQAAGGPWFSHCLPFLLVWFNVRTTCRLKECFWSMCIVGAAAAPPLLCPWVPREGQRWGWGIASQGLGLAPVPRETIIINH